jgi:signal transduction histidine kinase
MSGDSQDEVASKSGFTAGEIVERLPCEVELALFRVLQEAQTKRHANARSVDVEISVRREERYSNGSGRWQGHSGRGA